MNKERHVLLVYPHPDDESFGKAGSVALYTQAGTPVTLICGTLGELGRNMGKPTFANRETLPHIRKKELEEACRVLGIDDLRLLGLRDKTVEFEDPEWVADKIEAVIRDVKPSLLMTYYPKHGVHPDHNALSHAAVIAVKRLPKEERPVIYGSAVTHDARTVLGPPDVTYDVSSVLDTKLAAMRAHKSQFEAMFAQMEEQMAKSPEARQQVEANMSKEYFWIYRIED
ncbi:bacillithiol biosynthesis deacetylase BshB2 [Alicyclobacillus acidoterrestris]|uniref:Bacillithiol biosynthesis deacetylase BshB2 n=1 Tax=Alicyclobacillus acidoterrestris (strain ATCC 49025 / DSM 3922 / CIP 106132 / NCIMB 13137 / GD3B) TaxID=1356854 RepID=T0BSV4_ALIAG|nr:bacillithiol biosynthesis deacetylase BshB2 [Alicyclobacillus acidoterrestris]EPZ43540.1 deacetylase [Alicyclobacillus acidoterrestris ATCC 49025]UNO50218.1 bacillithiol biosynthesis deacetylase BshB2 [Alicyclobacillus acidoterrestris]